MTSQLWLPEPYREAALPTTRSWAVFSEGDAYRWTLGRTWGDGRRLTWLMLNPSTADQTEDDPTVTRCIIRSRAMGFYGCDVINIFALRATDPRELKAAADPVGPENMETLRRFFSRPNAPVVCAWGEHGKLFGQGEKVKALMRELGVKPWALAINKSGHPKHPLYVPYEIAPQPWAI